MPPGKGQSLLEVLIAVAVGAILFVGVGALIAPSVRVSKTTAQAQTAASLAQELMDNVRVWSEGSWSTLLQLATGSTNLYYLNTTSSAYSFTTGTQPIVVGTTTYTRSFYLSDVYRTGAGFIATTTAGNTYDPSTKMVTIFFTWTNGITSTLSTYLTRNRTFIVEQGDWSGGSGFGNAQTSTNNVFSSGSGLVYNVPGSVTVTSSVLSISGWATSSFTNLAVDQMPALYYNGYIYALGGMPGPSQNIWFAQVYPTGSIGAWSSTNSMTGELQPAVIAYNNALLGIGGQSVATVQYSLINTSTGANGVFTNNGTIPGSQRYYDQIVGYNNYIYTLAGSPATDSVDYLNISTTGTLITNFTTTTPFPVNLGITEGAGGAYNGYMYYWGGFAGGTTPTATVWYAPINSTGSLGAWATTTPMGTSSYFNGGTAYNGYLYNIGGADGANSVVTSSVLYAPLNSTGSVGAWSLTSPIPTGTNAGTALAYNGYLYYAGGQVGPNYTTTVYYTQINANGTLSNWTTTTAMHTPLVTPGFTAWNNYAYNLGGMINGGIGTATVYTAPFKLLGSLGAWATTSLLKSTEYGELALATNSYMYTIGGGGIAGAANVDYAAINGNGTLGTFFQGTYPLNAIVSNLAGFTAGAYVHEMGGDVGGLGTTTDAYGAIAPASVGPWTTTTPLLAPLYNMNYLYNQGYFYLIGGSDNAGNATRTVESSLVNSSTGVMGPWSTTTQLPTGTFTEVNTAILSNNNIYIFGGANGAAGAPVITSTVYFAPITGPGTLGAWSTAASLPVGEYQYPTVLNAYGQIYILGDGANGSSFEASQSVSTGTLVSTTYDTGLTKGGQFNSITWLGLEPAGTSIQFQFATANATSGPWNFTGPDGTSNTYYTPSSPGVFSSLNYNLYSGYRYFRYQALFVPTGTVGPTLNNVIVDWSP